MRALMWFRSDLRVNDNPALREAVAQGSDGVIAAFVDVETQWRTHDWGERRIAFTRRHVLSLREELHTLGIPLFIVTANLFSDANKAIETLAVKWDCHAIFANKEYEINERRRDAQMDAIAEKRGWTFQQFDDQVVLPPGSVQTQDGGWYKVYTPFKNKWVKVLAAKGGVPLPLDPPQPIPEHNSLLTDEHKERELPEAYRAFLSSDNLDDPAQHWEYGEEAAQQRLRAFAEHAMDEYHETRDFPGQDGTSALSPYLAVGAISSKQCLHVAMSKSPTPWPEAMGLKDGRAGWINELIWREFYRHLLIAFPKLCMYQPFQTHTKAVEWSDRDEEFEAWTQAQTGYPIVDAALRQLLETGWMHNRLRMVVAMFLTKNLLQDWRKGERFFMNHLIDGDLASNNGGWQWAASTGTDAAPYFRVFNPWSQSAKFDPDGTFIKHYLPELQDVPAKALHDPKRLLKHKPASYPDPICDHKSTRLHAIEVFKNLPK